jgi:hypothetical protein
VNLNSIQNIIEKYKRPNFDTYVPRWTFYLNSYIGGEDYINAVDTLIQHSFESPAEFADFKKYTFYPNYCKNIIDKMGRNIYRIQPIREGYELLLKAFIYKMVGGNITDNPNVFYRNVMQMLRVHGEIFTFFDHPSGDFNSVSDLQKDYEGIKYSEELILPQFVPVFESDLVVLALGNGRYKLWTPEEYIYYDAEGKVVPELSGPHDFGLIPIRNITIDKNMDGFGESDIRDISRICRIIYNLWNRNWKSKVDDSNLTTFFPLNEELIGMYDLLNKRNSEGKLDENLSKKEFYPAGHEPMQLPKDVSAFQDNRLEIEKLVELIRNLSNQRTEVNLATSGESKKYDIENYVSEQQMWAEILEAFEIEESIFKYEDILGVQVPSDFLIKYNKDFYPADESVSNTEYKSIFDDPTMPRTAVNKARLQYCLNILPLSPSEEKQIEKEIYEDPGIDVSAEEQENEPEFGMEKQQLAAEEIVEGAERNG